LGEQESGESTGEWMKVEGGMWIDDGEGPDDGEEQPKLPECRLWRRAETRGDRGEVFEGGERDL
jgi:hypothetical protein